MAKSIWYLGAEIKSAGFDLEHRQLIALIAPRAFLLLAGDSADDARSWSFIEVALPVYRRLGAEDNLGWVHHRKGHSYPLNVRIAATEFLDRLLK
jgi:hypothetical protein